MLLLSVTNHSHFERNAILKFNRRNPCHSLIAEPQNAVLSFSWIGLGFLPDQLPTLPGQCPTLIFTLTYPNHSKQKPIVPTMSNTNKSFLDSSSSSSSFSSSSIPSQIGSERNENERRESVAQIAARLSQGEDFRLAMKLQEEEFQTHFSKNRNERVAVAKDAKLSRKEEQKAEEERRKRVEEIVLRDEAMARELEKQILEEERKKAKDQEQKDEELARKMQSDGNRTQDCPSTRRQLHH